jgi:prenyltransferase beta subunit
MSIEQSDFFFNYLYEKQNEDGGYSDIAGSSNILSTYEMMETIDILNNTWVNQTDVYHKAKNDKISEFTNSCLAKDGWGFKFTPISSPDLSSMFPEYSFISGNINDSYPDIVSTYMGIKLAQRFGDANVVIEYYNDIASFINSTKFGGYALTNNSLFEVDPQSTYYGIKAFQEMNMTYNATSYLSLLLYLGSLYNNTDGGYAAFPGNSSDAVSTYYVIASYTALGVPLNYAQENYNFLKTCQKLDGGFGFQPDVVFSSDFISGWAVSNAIEILLLNGSLIFDVNELNQLRINFYQWLYEHQAANALFGSISVEANYWGVNTE